MRPESDSFEVLSICLQRTEILGRLSERPADKRTLAGDLDVSRSTVDRAIRDLETHDLVTYDEGEYELTPFGKQVTLGATALLEEIEVARDLQPVLQYLPTDEFDLDLRVLADADVYLPEPGNPWAMVNHHVNALKQADEIRAVLPLVGLHGHEAVHERVTEHGADAEMVGCPEVIRTLVSDPDFVDLTEEVDASDRHRMFELAEQPSYFLGLIDDVVQIGVDEDGDPRALIESTHPEVRAWAERTYERFKERATPVTAMEAESIDESTIE